MGVNLANAFACDLAYSVCVVSFFKSGAKPFYPLDSRISCVYLCNRPAKSKNALITLFNKTLFRAWMCFKARKFILQSDIILANDGWFVPFFRDKSRFFVRLWHLNAPKRARKKLRLFDALVILSEREIKLWQRYHRNVKVIPNFLPQMPQNRANLNTRIILSAGRMDEGDQKGFLRLLDIWKIAQDSQQNWQLVIVGDGALKGEIEAKIHALNLGESVALKPFTQEIAREYLSASIYAMASHFEGFPMALIEASSFALPCVAFDIRTGPSDIIAHEKSGLLVEDGDLQGFASALIRLMREDSTREKFGKNAREIVGEKFSKEAIMARWEELFSSFA